MRMSAYELIEGKDSKLELRVTFPVCLANIVQRLYELIESYRFYYFGIDAPDESIEGYKKSLELGFPYAAQCDIATHRRHAETLLASNFTLNVVEIATEELLEVLLTLRAIVLAKSSEDYSTATESLKSRRQELLKCPFPTLLKQLNDELGPLLLEPHIFSINQMRRILVHRSGVVDTDNLVLRLYVPKVLADYSMASLASPVVIPPNTPGMLHGKDFTVEWKPGETVLVDYELCLKIAFTVLSFFGNVINIAGPRKYPELAPAEGI